MKRASKKKQRKRPEAPKRRGKPFRSPLRDPVVYEALRGWLNRKPRPVPYRTIKFLLKKRFRITRAIGSINHFVKVCDKAHIAPHKVFSLPPLLGPQGPVKSVGAAPVATSATKPTQTKSGVSAPKRKFEYDGE